MDFVGFAFIIIQRTLEYLRLFNVLSFLGQELGGQARMYLSNSDLKARVIKTQNTSSVQFFIFCSAIIRHSTNTHI